MQEHRATTRQYAAQIEDVVLAVLGFVAGPLLWWMSQTWQQNPAATSIQTLEYGIALLCGFLGIGLSTMWVIFLLAGFVFAVAIKTKNKMIGYWSGLFTPKFLQRIIVSVIGLQLTFGSQAIAAEEAPSDPTQVTSTASDNPFMPELAEMSAVPEQDPAPEPMTMPSTAVTSPELPTEAPLSSVSNTPSTPLAPQPRQSTQIVPEADSKLTATADSNTPKAAPDPTPRQTTTIAVPQQPAGNTVDQKASTPGLPDTYLPQKSVPSPYIAAPNPDRSVEDPTLVIQTGDSLWDIAHQELGADSTMRQIDQRWRQWWQHNLDLIGDDPHVLSPGTVLKAPPFTH